MNCKHLNTNNTCYINGIICPLLHATNKEIKACYERKSLCGFLSPDGIYYYCEPFDHMNKAKEICKELYNLDLISSLDAENYLLNNSFVAFYSRSVGFLAFGNLGTHSKETKKVIRLLSDKQIEFLEEALKYCYIEEKYNMIKDILNEDYYLKNDNYYKQLYEQS